MVVVDSNVFVSMFSEKDPNFNKSQKILEKIVKKTIEVGVPSVFLPEICGAIRRIANKDFALSVKNEIKKWIDTELISVYEITKKRMEDASDMAINLSLKGGDSIFVSLANELDVELLTFDDEINKKIRGKIKIFEI
jgi:predicted nucleic acid-binding protein